MTESKKQTEHLNEQSQLHTKEIAKLVDEKLNLNERNIQLQKKLNNSRKIIEESQKENSLLVADNHRSNQENQQLKKFAAPLRAS